jgi:alkylation response protein AidB-like acyl-CoA dehydrogenase
MTILDEFHEWLTLNWDPDLALRDWWARLAGSGWSQPHWPKGWYGRGLSRGDAAAVQRAVREFGAVTAPAGFGTGMAGPTLLDHGTDDQRSRHLPGIADGTDCFCQLFSEPNAGSDLAGLQCRAQLDGGEWVVNGQKVWTSGGQIANKAMLVARTDPSVPKHAGISYFIIDTTQPGVEMRPLREMTGRSYFNEVFLTDARVPVEDLVGGEGNGWAVANTTLAYERALSGGAEPGTGADPGPVAGNLDRRAGDFVPVRSAQSEAPALSRSMRLAALAASRGRDRDPTVVDALMRLYALEQVNNLTSQRARALQASGRELPGLPNLAKMNQNHAIRLGRELTFSILGVEGTLHAYQGSAVSTGDDGIAADEVAGLIDEALFAQGPPIYGGSDQIQRNIVGERVLGLPREPNTEKGIPFKDLPKN